MAANFSPKIGPWQSLISELDLYFLAMMHLYAKANSKKSEDIVFQMNSVRWSTTSLQLNY